MAMATATKVLTALQSEGAARAVPGVGTFVDRAPGAGGDGNMRPGMHSGMRPGPLGRARVVETGLRIADHEGLSALSMRRVAAELGVTTTSLYRHVSDHEHLILLMADAVHGGFAMPEPPPPGWRRRLETAARTQWAMFRRHPWLAEAASFTRPLITPRTLAHSEWMMRALDGLGLDNVTVLHAAVSISAHVRGLAVNLESEAEARAQTRVTDEQWMGVRVTPVLSSPSADPAFPRLAAVPPGSLDLDSLLEFGLERLLDGIAELVRRADG